jgi:putative flippase GtrA
MIKFATKYMHKKVEANKFVAFLCIGGFCAALSLVLMYLFTSLLRLHYLFSFILVFFIGNSIGFYFNKNYTFQTKQQYFWKELSKYFTVMASSFFVNLILMFLMVNTLKIWYLYANLILIVFFAFINFMIHSKWSFNKSS